MWGILLKKNQYSDEKMALLSSSIYRQLCSQRADFSHQKNVEPLEEKTTNCLLPISSWGTFPRFCLLNNHSKNQPHNFNIKKIRK